MMKTLHLESAIPSLLCLALLYFLPWAARQSLTLWRAVQVYDRQQIKSPIIAIKEKPKWYKFLGLLYVAVVITLEVTFFTSSGKEWRKELPLLAQLRDAVPVIVLAIMIISPCKLLFQHYLAPITTASRAWRATSKKTFGVMNISKKYTADESAANNFSIRSTIVWIASFASTIIAINLSQSVSSQSPLYIAAASGSILLVLFAQYSQFDSKRLTFRGLILWPVIVMALSLAFLAVVSAVVYVISYFSEGKKADVVIATESLEPKSASQDSDLALAQLLAIIYTYIWALMLVAPYTIVCFAYRFDAAQAGYASVDDKEADAIIEQRSTEVKDDAGYISIPLSSVALPRATLTSADLPTFNAALRTLVAVQAVGVVVDAYTQWQDQVIYPTSVSQLPLPNNISINLWPFLAYPLISVAMIMSTRRRSNASFKSLWTYGEPWNVVIEHQPTETAPDSFKVEETKTLI